MGAITLAIITRRKNNEVTYSSRYSSCSASFFIVKFVFSRVSKVSTFFEINWIIDNFDTWAAYNIERQQMLK